MKKTVKVSDFEVVSESELDEAMSSKLGGSIGVIEALDGSAAERLKNAMRGCVAQSRIASTYGVEQKWETVRVSNGVVFHIVATKIAGTPWPKKIALPSPAPKKAEPTPTPSSKKSLSVYATTRAEFESEAKRLKGVTASLFNAKFVVAKTVYRVIGLCSGGRKNLYAVENQTTGVIGKSDRNTIIAGRVSSVTAIRP